MKKIKNAFGRFYLKHPKKSENLKVLSFTLFLAFVLAFPCFLLLGKLVLSLISVGVGLFFLALLCFFLFSSEWAKKLPEYFMSEAEKILESKVVSPRLESLIELVKINGQEDRLNELKNWLKLFENYKSLKEKLPQLQKKQGEITLEISLSMAEMKDLQMDLLIL